MRFGLAEIFLIFIILIVLVGPSLSNFVNHAQERAVRRLAKNSAERARQLQALRIKRQKRQKKIKIISLSVLGSAVVLTCLYFAFYPLNIEVLPYQVDEPLGLAVEQLQAKTMLDYENMVDVPYIFTGISRKYDGWVYTVANGGVMLRVRENGTGLMEVFTAESEIVGFDFTSNGDIVFTQLEYENGTGTGALMKATFDGLAITQEVLVSSFVGQEFGFVGAVEVTEKDEIYFSNLSCVRAPEIGMDYAVRKELLANTNTGAVYRTDLNGKNTMLVGYNLSMPSGLAVDEGSGILYISELTAKKVWALPTSLTEVNFAANNEESLQVISAGLESYPKALYAQNGELHAEFLVQKFEWLDAISEQTFLRSVILRLPEGTLRYILPLN